jgi:hypothetical protein
VCRGGMGMGVEKNDINDLKKERKIKVVKEGGGGDEYFYFFIIFVLLFFLISYFSFI